MADAIKVGSTTLFTAGYGPEQRAELSKQLVEIKLLAAELAYAGGERAGLLEAIRLLREHDPQRTWPKWMCDAAAGLLETAPSGGRGGRHSRETTRRRANAVDAIRAYVVDSYLKQGLSERAAFKAASKSIHGTAEGTWEVMRTAHERFHQRVEQNPARYYGFIDDLALLLMQVVKERPR